MGFPLEAGAELRVVGECVRHDFDRDRAIEPGVACPIHLAHAACPERLFDPIRSQLAVGFQRSPCVEYRSGRFQHRPIEDDGRAVLCEQRRHFPPQRFVAAGGLDQERDAGGRVALERRLIQARNTLPTLGIHLRLEVTEPRSALVVSSRSSSRSDRLLAESHGTTCHWRLAG